MIRYKKQTDKFRCGPVAILNALKWAGIRADLEDISKKAKCRPFPHGTTCPELHNALLKFEKFIKIRITCTVNIEFIRNQLSNGRSIIYNYEYYDKEDDRKYGHYFFIDSMSKTGKSLYLVNYKLNGPARIRMTTKKFVNQCIRGNSDPTVWIIEKK